MSSEIHAIRTRFAPSPTGDPHIGSVWTALFNWLYARHNNGKFILRIEDTDQSRLVAGAENQIIEALRWLNLDYDEGPDIGGPFGPYRQSERMPLYKKYAEALIDSGAAYYCFCSTARLQELRARLEKNKMPSKYDGLCRQLNQSDSRKKVQAGESAVVRLEMPVSGSTVVEDLIRGKVIFRNELIDDQVLLKASGWPTYHLASVVDDHLMKINPVIRAEEWLPSTPKQLMIYSALGWSPPRFAHLPLILGADRAKLSKRHGSVSINKFRADGYLTEAIINFLALLGWNPKTAEEFFDRQTLINKFSLEAVNKSGAIFNVKKLDWFNAHYLKNLPPRDLLRLSAPFFKTSKLDKLPAEKIEKILKLSAERAKKLSDMPAIVNFVFALPQYESSLLCWKMTDARITKERLVRMREIFTKVKNNDFYEDRLEQKIKAEIEANNLGVGETLWPLRAALSGLKDSPSPFILADILGRDECLVRLNLAIAKLTDQNENDAKIQK